MDSSNPFNDLPREAYAQSDGQESNAARAFSIWPQTAPAESYARGKESYYPVRTSCRPYA